MYAPGRHCQPLPDDVAPAEVSELMKQGVFKRFRLVIPVGQNDHRSEKPDEHRSPDPIAHGEVRLAAGDGHV